MVKLGTSSFAVAAPHSSSYIPTLFIPNFCESRKLDGDKVSSLKSEDLKPPCVPEAVEACDRVKPKARGHRGQARQVVAACCQRRGRGMGEPDNYWDSRLGDNYWDYCGHGNSTY